MKGSLKLRSRRPLTRSEAWACFTANLALPGSGSLAAGRAVGYAQLAAAFGSLIFTMAASIPMIKMVLSGGLGALQSPTGDPFQQMGETWHYVHWPLAGMVLFAGSTLWAMSTSMAVLSKTPKDGVPPRIT
ncbi:MAG TPA: hypothetical protein VGO59_17435 [Verrucomicrobiae bacterium]|jgi:hypothetical protein